MFRILENLIEPVFINQSNKKAIALKAMNDFVVHLFLDWLLAKDMHMTCLYMTKMWQRV